MIAEYHQLKILTKLNSSVGGGSAGCVLASRLSENPNTTVLLLEAGKNEQDSLLSDIPLMAPHLQLTDIDWQYRSERNKGFCRGLIDNVNIFLLSRYVTILDKFSI